MKSFIYIFILLHYVGTFVLLQIDRLYSRYIFISELWRIMNKKEGKTYTNRYPKIFSFSSLFGGLWNIGDSALYLFFLRHTPLLTPHEILLLIPPTRPTVLFMTIITPIITHRGSFHQRYLYFYERTYFSRSIKKLAQPNCHLLIITLL